MPYPRRLVILLLMLLTALLHAQPPDEPETVPDPGIENPESPPAGESEDPGDDAPVTEAPDDAPPELTASDESAPSESSTDPGDEMQAGPGEVLQELCEALKTGDSETVLRLISEEALGNMEMMLEVLHDDLDRDEESLISRMTSAGYVVTADEVDDWEPEDYLAAAVPLPMMKTRYAIYDMEIGEYTVDGDEAEIPLLFTTAAGAEFPFDARLVMEDDLWKVSAFMGLTSLP